MRPLPHVSTQDPRTTPASPDYSSSIVCTPKGELWRGMFTPSLSTPSLRCLRRPPVRQTLPTAPLIKLGDEIPFDQALGLTTDLEISQHC